jgi:hypothetical protein
MAIVMATLFLPYWTKRSCDGVDSIPPSCSRETSSFSPLGSFKLTFMLVGLIPCDALLLSCILGFQVAEVVELEIFLFVLTGDSWKR